MSAATPESNRDLRAQLDAARARRTQAAQKLKELAEETIAATPVMGISLEGMNTPEPEPGITTQDDLQTQLKKSREARSHYVACLKQTVQAFTTYRETTLMDLSTLRERLRGDSEQLSVKIPEPPPPMGW